MKQILCTLILALWAFSLSAQSSGEKGYGFLSLPVSAHAAALGGENISLIDDDINLALHNPALLSSVSDRTISFGYMSYMDGINALHAAYAKVLNDRATWGIGVDYLNYGTLSRRDELDTDLGTFSAKDMNFMGLFAYNLTDYWSGGVTAKAIYCSYDSYSSFALAVDLGLNYYNAAKDFSGSVCVKNLGGELKAFDQNYTKLPLDLQVGISKKLSDAPVSYHITASQLQDWSDSFMKHFNFGVDIYPSKSLYIAAGYSCRRASDLKVGESSHGAGWSFGAGLHVRRIKVDASYGVYHVSGGSLLLNFAYTL